jgi:hypothetical protein
MMWSSIWILSRVKCQVFFTVVKGEIVTTDDAKKVVLILSTEQLESH